jgi:hypothetical protein
VFEAARSERLFSFEPGGTITFVVRAFDDLGDRIALDREAGRMDRVLGVDYGLCECGCGEESAVSHKTDRSKRWVKGRPLRFKRGHAILGRKVSFGKKYDCRILSEFELGWIAGLLEGEGSFSVRKGNRKYGSSCTPTIQLTSTDEDVVKRLHELIPSASFCRPTRKTKGNKQTYRWALSNSEAVTDVLIVLFPLMGKRRQNRIREVLAHPTFLRYEDVRKADTVSL